MVGPGEELEPGDSGVGGEGTPFLVVNLHLVDHSPYLVELLA